ncbi:MAG: tripartite tricarboxylate transporter substrate binding protein [Betaproteobacteria bacterium]|nr:MAG: tripartite tricarboxylate transporter substrate binding protein [Betaproteobacteria bacterium]
MQRAAFALYLIFAVFSGCAWGQTWPSRPIRIIVAGAPGSSLDIPVRAVGEKLKDRLAQPIVVENRPAAGGTVATDAAAKAAPDGYTYVMSFNGPLAYGPYLYSKLPYDPQKDLAAVIQMGGQPFVLAVPASLGVSRLKELIDLARASPGKLNYSSLGNGSGTHITMELLKSRAKIFMVHIPYAGGPAAAAAVATGEVQAHFAPIATIMPHVRAGRARLIAMSSEKRFSLMPEIPTVAEQGFPGFDSYGWNGILAPAATPRDIVVRMNREINEVLKLPEIRTLLANQHIEIAGGTPEEFAALIKRETERWGPVIRASGAKLD